MPKLNFIGEHLAGQVYELTLEKTTVGRGDFNTLVLRDKSVSLAHCEILVHGSEVIVRDLGSANGTFVNDLRLDHQQCQVKSGQTVRFGSVEVSLELELPTWDDTASEETAVFAMRRNELEQKRNASSPKPPSAAATFGVGPDSGATDTERTVLMSASPRPKRQPTPPEPPKPEVPARNPWKIVSIVLGAVVLFWLIWGKK